MFSLCTHGDPRAAAKTRCFGTSTLSDPSHISTQWTKMNPIQQLPKGSYVVDIDQLKRQLTLDEKRHIIKVIKTMPIKRKVASSHAFTFTL